MSGTIEDRTVILGLALALALSVLALAPPAEAQPRPGTPGDALRWSPCYQEVGPDFECALAPVPLDHSRSNGGGTIQLSLVRLAATDPGARIGSLFFNPGGPGGSGVDFLLNAGPVLDQLYGAAIRERFDLVGFDPRGIGRSTAVRCFGNLRQASAALPPLAFPLDPVEEALFASADGVLADQCDRRGNRISAHMSTANVARDLDLLRQRAGDEQLSFVGFSYGSYLGVVYANLFPDRVRAVVVDGVLDPVAWRNAEGEIPFSARLGSDIGAQDTLERFFELCEGRPQSCALAPGAEQRFAAMAAQLRDAPIRLLDPVTGEDFLLSYQDVIGVTLSALYDPFSYVLLAQLLAEVEALADPASVGTAFAALREANQLVNRRGHPNYQNVAEGFPAVTCSDSSNPTSYATWSQAGASADADSYFGRLWTWVSSPCAQWPSADQNRYDGGFGAVTDAPVLVVNPRYDPATPVEGALAVRSLLPGSALVLADIPGHTTLGISGCAGGITGQYLLTPDVFAEAEIQCPEEFNPFDLAPVPPQGEGLAGDLRAKVLPEMAFSPVR